MPLYALAFALLWPLAGPGLAAGAGAPFDFKTEAVAQDVRRQFEFLGYRFDEKTGQVYRQNFSGLPSLSQTR